MLPFIPTVKHGCWTSDVYCCIGNHNWWQKECSILSENVGRKIGIQNSPWAGHRVTLGLSQMMRLKWPHNRKKWKFWSSHYTLTSSLRRFEKFLNMQIMLDNLIIHKTRRLFGKTWTGSFSLRNKRLQAVTDAILVNTWYEDIWVWKLLKRNIFIISFTDMVTLIIFLLCDA